MSMLAQLLPLMLSLAPRDIDDSTGWRCRALELPAVALCARCAG